MDVTQVQTGVWGVSRIIDVGGSFATAALVQQPKLANTIECYYPPMVGGTYSVGYALVRLFGNVGTPDAETFLFPESITTTLGSLKGEERTMVLNNLNTKLQQYSFYDFDGSYKTVNKFSDITVSYTGTTTVSDVIRDIFKYTSHSTSRQKQATPESHNTEYTDDFSTDPYSAPRWTNVSGTHVWDSTNLELDMSLTVGQPIAIYSQNGPGSIEHESQVTCIFRGNFNFEGAGVAVRANNDGTTKDCYAISSDRGNSYLKLVRILNGSSTQLVNWTVSAFGSTDFWTTRLAAAGTAGSNVSLSFWRNNHGTTKPSDPGWYGTDGSPNETYTDTSSDRLDDTFHSLCGIGGQGQGADIDTRCDFWKSRAISDRSGGPAPAVTNKIPTLLMLGVG